MNLADGILFIGPSLIHAGEHERASNRCINEATQLVATRVAAHAASASRRFNRPDLAGDDLAQLVMIQLLRRGSRVRVPEIEKRRGSRVVPKPMGVSGYEAWLIVDCAGQSPEPYAISDDQTWQSFARTPAYSEPEALGFLHNAVGRVALSGVRKGETKIWAETLKNSGAIVEDPVAPGEAVDWFEGAAEEDAIRGDGREGVAGHDAETSWAVLRAVAEDLERLDARRTTMVWCVDQAKRGEFGEGDNTIQQRFTKFRELMPIHIRACATHAKAGLCRGTLLHTLRDDAMRDSLLDMVDATRERAPRREAPAKSTSRPSANGHATRSATHETPPHVDADQTAIRPKKKP